MQVPGSPTRAAAGALRADARDAWVGVLPPAEARGERAATVGAQRLALGAAGAQPQGYDAGVRGLGLGRPCSCDVVLFMCAFSGCRGERAALSCVAAAEGR